VRDVDAGIGFNTPAVRGATMTQIRTPAKTSYSLPDRLRRGTLRGLMRYLPMVQIG
jgi:hypothetical protein